jgi:SAM-dependent methyltransferase
MTSPAPALAGRNTSPALIPTATPDELAAFARRFYQEGPYLMRKLTHYRIHICPFERLIPHVPPGASVLDVGCGAGLFLALLAGAVPGVTGLGFDTGALAIGTAERMAEGVRSSGLPAKLQFFRLDATEPWPAGPFDVVSLVDVLHHVPVAAQKDVFHKAAAAVRPGGLLLYKDMASRPRFQAAMNRLHDLVLAGQWIHYVPIRFIEEWARGLDLTCCSAETVSRLWYRHELRVYRKSDRHG